MKKFYALIALIIFFLSAFAEIHPIGSGSNKDHWSLKSVPKDGDNIVIPKGYGMVGNGIVNVFSIPDIKNKLSLPVKFTGFYAVKSGENIQLSWSTAIDINNSHFSVERSFDGTDWTDIAIIMDNNISNTDKSYGYTDKKISNAVVYYRLRQVDMNGNKEFSSVRVIGGNQENTTTVYASTKQTITVDFNAEIKNNFVIKVFTSSGQKIAEQVFQSSSYKVSLKLNNATTGLYIVQITDNKAFSETKRVKL